MTQPGRSKSTRIRCAVYTRKSTDEGLDREFNSLDAQREACEAYIASQKHEGWVCLATRFDDGGFTGGNLDRPAVKQLLAEIQKGEINCVVVYKVDRLSRSLLDFARMMEAFDQHHVSFVSVTQQFNTSTSMGRLTLNVLLSFAQFEREIISERTRDKMRAARRKGKRLGGRPVLGYGVDPQTRQLVVDPHEAEQVRAIFTLYRELGGLIPTVRELARRGWITKRWTTRKGTIVGGHPFHKARLHYLLTNLTYLGQVKYEDRVFDGEHAAIVTPELFEAVQQCLRQNRRQQSRPTTKGFQGMLEGLLYCSTCDIRMRHTYTSRGSRRYRYYSCPQAKEQGSDTCRAGSIPAAEIESLVWTQLGEELVLGARETLTTTEQADRLSQFVERVDYDGREGDLAIRLANRPREDS